MSLSDLVFSDLFVAENAETSWYKATPDSLIATPVPTSEADELAKLRLCLDEHAARNAFRIDWPTKNGMRLRVERIHVEESKTIYVCRRYRLLVSKLSSLGMPGTVTKKLLQTDLRHGLVVFFGKAGSGKTTTAGALIVERLSQYGGVCWTVENPIELPLQGQHGKGWCYQTEVSCDELIGPAVRNLMRATPNIIFIGELRDSIAVREAITAANSGHLVIATFHASDLCSGLARLARFAGDGHGGTGLAESMRVAIHLNLHNAESGNLPGLNTIAEPGSKGTGTPPRILSVEPLWISGENASGLHSLIRNGDFHMLKSEIDRQLRGLMMDRLPG